jgi:hypothetical protein
MAQTAASEAVYEGLLGWLHAGLASVAGELLDREQKLKSSRRAMAISERLGNDLPWIYAAVLHADELTNCGQFARGFGRVLKPFYLRLRAAGKPAKVALVAAARKLLTILNLMLKTKTAWRPPCQAAI